MSYNTPAQTAQAAVESGVAKGNLPISSMLVGGFLAGAYIAFGGLLAIVATAGMPAAIWGGLITLVTGLVFSVGLVLTVIGGAELLTGNMMYLPIAALARRLSVGKVAVNWIVVLVGNLIGSLFVAYVLAYKSGLVAGDPTQPNHIRLIAIATAKVVTETHLEVFIRAIGCNWLVCLAVWPGARGARCNRQDRGNRASGHRFCSVGLRPRRGEYVLPATGAVRARSERHHGKCQLESADGTLGEYHRWRRVRGRRVLVHVSAGAGLGCAGHTSRSERGAGPGRVRQAVEDQSRAGVPTLSERLMRATFRASHRPIEPSLTGRHQRQEYQQEQATARSGCGDPQPRSKKSITEQPGQDPEGHGGQDHDHEGEHRADNQQPREVVRKPTSSQGQL